MHWVLDRTLIRERGHADLIAALERQGVPYSEVMKPPFADWLCDENKERVELDVGHDVFVTGTLSMRLVSERYDWNPGYVEGMNQETIIEAWGEEVLNHDAQIAAFRDLVVPDQPFFARPVEDTKSFSGTVYNPQDFIDCRKRVMNIETSEATITGDDLVMTSTLKKIYAEYRLFVIDGKIVTGSRYKLGSRVEYSETLDPAMLEYARARIKEFCPIKAMCLDIAHIEGPEPYKVIETNSISSAGFYACDMNAFVGAINEAYFG